MAILSAALTLFGWVFDVEPLKSVLPGLVAMNPATAVAFGAVGLSVWLASFPANRRGVQRSSRVFAVVAVGIAALKLLGYTGLDLGIDRLLFSDGLGAYKPPNRMAPNTAINFLLQGLALLFIDFESRKGRRPFQALPFLSGTISLLAIVGYAYGVRSMYGLTSFIPMALNTAVSFFILDVGILCARPDQGIMAVVSARSLGGLLARRLIPAALSVPLGVGFLSRLGVGAGYYDLHFGFALLVVLTVLLLGGLGWWTASTAHRLASERTAAIELLQVKSGELETLNGELEAFSHSVSHDLRAPLRHIEGYSKLLREHLTSGIDANSRHFLDTISNSVRDMGQLIDDLLSFSKMARAEFRAKHVDVQSLVSELSSELTGREGGRQVRWEIGPLPNIKGDPAMMKVVWSNLLSNALKYTRPREAARIKVGHTIENGEQVFFVKDNGVGFDMRSAAKLFGVFQRLHGKEEFEGTGIGLANVRRVISRHGGRTWAEGRLDEGATFYFSLPAKVDGGKAS